MKYKVNFSGFAYVEADDHQGAEELFLNDETVYAETEIISTEEVDDFSIRL